MIPFASNFKNLTKTPFWEKVSKDRELTYLLSLFINQSSRVLDRDQLDQERLLRLLVFEHRLLNFLFEKGYRSHLPRALAQSLNQARLEQKKRVLNQLFLLQELKAVLKDYEFILLKGLGLSQILYGDYSFRDSSDIDLLIRSCDEKNMIESLSLSGFERFKNHEHHFVVKKRGISIELHRKLSPIFNTKSFEIKAWDKCQPLAIGKETYRILDDADHLNYLLMNGTNKGWCRLAWVLDFYRFIEKIGQQNLLDELRPLWDLFQSVFIQGQCQTFEQNFVVSSFIQPGLRSTGTRLKRALYFSRVSNQNMGVSMLKSVQRFLMHSIS